MMWHVQALGLLLAACGLPVAARAGDAGEIVIANQVVLRIRTGARDVSAAERTRIVTRRVVDVLSYEDTQHPDVRIVKTGVDRAIHVGKTLLVTVQESDAKANLTTPEALARVWAANVARELPHATPVSKLPGFTPEKLNE
jgi:hypothetical protein